MTLGFNHRRKETKINLFISIGFDCLWLSVWTPYFYYSTCYFKQLNHSNLLRNIYYYTLEKQSSTIVNTFKRGLPFVYFFDADDIDGFVVNVMQDNVKQFADDLDKLITANSADAVVFDFFDLSVRILISFRRIFFVILKYIAKSYSKLKNAISFTVPRKTSCTCWWMIFKKT